MSTSCSFTVWKMAEVVIRGTRVDFGSKFFFPRGATPRLETNRHSGSKLGSGSVQHLIRIPYQGSTPVQGRGRKGEAELPCKHSKASSDLFGVVFPLSVHLEWQLWDLGHPRKYRLCIHQSCPSLPSPEEDCMLQLQEPGVKPRCMRFHIF